MKPILAIAKKDIQLLVRDKGALFWVLGFPIVMALFFGAIFSGAGPAGAMSVAVVDLDQSARSKAFLADLGASKSIKLDPQSLEAAKALVRKGDRAAYIAIPKGFGEAPLFGPSESAALEIGHDPKRQAEFGMLQGLVTETWFKQMQTALSDPGEMKKQSDSAKASLDSAAIDPARKQAILDLLASIERANSVGGISSSTMGSAMQGPQIKQASISAEGQSPATAFEVSFPQGMLWGLIGITMAFSVGLVKERTMGTLGRLNVSPVTSAQLLGGKALACFLMTVGVLLCMLLLGVVVGVRSFLHPVEIGLAVLSSGICFVGLSLFLNIFGKTEEAVGGAGRAFMLILAMLGGGMIPVIAMPPWMLSASQVSPVRWAATALEGAIWRGYSVSDMLLPCGILVAVGVAAFSVGVLAHRQQTA